MERQSDVTVPSHLQEGWQAYRQWWEARYRSGNPLPAGGAFILNRRAVLLDELYRFHCEVADGLGLPLRAVTLDLETDEKGRVAPKAEICPPPGWTPPTCADNGDDTVAQEYVTGFLKVVYDQMQTRLSRRVSALSQIRPELAPRWKAHDQ